MESTKDVLTYKQKAVQILSKDELNILLDEHYSKIFTFLRNSPKTVEEILEIFSNSTISKSKKTIYRYLNFLTKKNLIHLAGKRVIVQPDQKLSSYNLYIRSSKFYLNQKFISEENRMDSDVHGILQQYCTGMSCFLEILLGKDIDFPPFFKKMSDLIIKKESALLEMLRVIPIQKLERIKDIDYLELNRILESVLWMNLIYTNPSIHENIKSILDELE
ncbi:hypothetical protein DSAG12_03912 [Promethearchaeum syntrophicum]|uniref:Uncharacterized protein n=1 Tax=Promethearchaeum syntrophicum TaxID=2594042 RepID=A0A5B9DG26_9ARCH|nr:hypothetical protein [Candidatus Prometheoarchaeum syntrophicum]QEE18074.1 hypothetical protein DSAG12_03912 [Candidatus Prometheoarchaeum syntrophicum]